MFFESSRGFGGVQGRGQLTNAINLINFIICLFEFVWISKSINLHLTFWMGNTLSLLSLSISATPSNRILCVGEWWWQKRTQLHLSLLPQSYGSRIASFALYPCHLSVADVACLLALSQSGQSHLFLFLLLLLLMLLLPMLFLSMTAELIISFSTWCPSCCVLLLLVCCCCCWLLRCSEKLHSRVKV